MNTEIDYDKLPYKTAPEYIDEFAEKMELPTDLREEARDIAIANPELSNAPKTIAAACVYLAAQSWDMEMTQWDVYMEVGVAPPSIRSVCKKVVVE